MDTLSPTVIILPHFPKKVNPLSPPLLALRATSLLQGSSVTFTEQNIFTPLFCQNQPLKLFLCKVYKKNNSFLAPLKIDKKSQACYNKSNSEEQECATEK